MSSSPFPYPSTPENVDPGILEPSASFKREAIKVLCGILFFILVYLLLITAALALAALCAILGIGLVVVKPMFITIMLGLGLAGIGVMVVVFLIKFLFKKHKVDLSRLTEIKQHEQPRLFAFIATLARETQTPFPKKIYLSPDVNASVSYNSTFWSMFFPVRKNLQIGLGLVNAVNLSEFKAIVAHEFGHFSQRSMKLGSYIYNMNQVIFNLLYDNENYERALGRWAAASSYFTFFAVLTIRIVRGIQWILQQVYIIVNEQYMSLSRQMEFHADTLSASVSGGNHLITSLRRLEVAGTTYQNVFAFYRENFKESLQPLNIFPQHKEMMKVFATLHDLPLQHGLPQINKDSFNRFNKSRITIKDQWASHPSTDEREAHLQSLNVVVPASAGSAWLLFDHQEELQKRITKKAFEGVPFESDVTVMDEEAFRARYHSDMQRYQLPKLYKGFFDGRLISICGLHNIESQLEYGTELETLLTEEVIALPYRKEGIFNDIGMLTAITDKTLKIKHFDFEGKKYKSTDAAALLPRLQEELQEVDKALSAADQRMISWFIRTCSDAQRENLRSAYNDLFVLTRQTVNDLAVYGEVQECLRIMSQTLATKQIQSALATLKNKETAFKNQLERVLRDPAYTPFIDADQAKTAAEYLSKDWQYFTAQMYVQVAFDRLNDCLHLYYQALNERLFNVKADLLKSQLHLVGLEMKEDALLG